MNNSIGFIGAGKMAGAIIKGIIDSKIYDAKNILVSDLNKESLENMHKEFGITPCSDNAQVVKNADVIIFAVKPFVLKDVLKDIAPFIQGKTVISIAAGISIDSIEEILGNEAVIRVMPNTPALVNEGMSAICKGHYAKDKDVQTALNIFKSVGKVIEADEKYIDVITAVSGSGPAFYYYIINEFAKAGEKLGMDYKTCLKLSAQTAYGSAKMIMDTGISPEQLIINVTTPGGTTEAGNNVLKNRDTSEILYATIEETMKKSKALGKN